MVQTHYDGALFKSLDKIGHVVLENNEEEENPAQKHDKSHAHNETPNQKKHNHGSKKTPKKLDGRQTTPSRS